MFSRNQEQGINRLMELCSNIKREKLEVLYSNWEQKHVVETRELESGLTIQLFHQDEKLWQLNSSCEPYQAAALWAEQFNLPEINEHSILFVFGMGDGRAVWELARKKKDCKIMIYEPSSDIFWEAIEREEWAKLLDLSNIYLFIEGINEEYFFHSIQEFLDYSNIQLTHLGVLPNYERIFQESYIKFRQIIESAMELVIYTRNTELQRIEEMTKNMFALSEDILRQYSAQQLFGCVERMGWQQVPAILIAAGPSLDDCIVELHDFRNKAFFLAVDTALNTLLENDIIPDLTISVDSRKPITLFKNHKFCDIPIVLSQQSNQEVVKMNKAIHFYEVDEEAYLNRIINEETGKTGVQLPTGGSVANNGLSLLVQMGFQTIILVGQDFAYPNLKLHTEAAYSDGNNTISPEQNEYVLVEDVHGNLIYTQKNMNIYRKWMEQYIAGYPDIDVINVSECGAHIVGTRQISMRECMNQYSLSIETHNLWKTAVPFLEEKEQSQLMARIERIPMAMDKLECMVDEGVQLYNDTENILVKKDYIKIKELLNKAVELTSQIESVAETALIRAYMIEQHYAIQEKIYQYSEDDSIEKQVWDMICNGKELMLSFKMAIEKVRDNYH